MEDGATCQCSVDEQHLAGNSRDIFVFLFCVKFEDSKQFMADCHGEQTSDWDRESVIVFSVYTAECIWEVIRVEMR